MELECITTDADSVPEGVNPNAISIKGYTKKASDSKEAFFVTNRTDRTISQIKIRLRYTTLTGEQLHERVATVNVTLRAGETRLVTIKSWDIQRQFYYYAGAKPRKKASNGSFTTVKPVITHIPAPVNTGTTGHAIITHNAQSAGRPIRNY